MEVPDVHYVRNGGVALAYQVFGNGPVELVYAPQWINNLEVAWSNPLFARFLNRLASFARVVFVDRRGMGLSDRLSATDVPPLETLMEDLRVVIDSAGFKRPVLFGGSDAGCICALFAATHPDRTSALIVYGPEARGTASSDYPWAWTTEEWEVYLADMDAGWGTDEYAARTFEWIMPSARADPEQRRWWRTMQRLSATPSSMIAIERIWAELDIRPVLPTIQAPTLVLHRRGDPVERVEAGRDFAQRIPGARVRGARGRGLACVGGRPEGALRCDRVLSARHPRGGGRTRARSRDRALHRHRRLDREGDGRRRPRLEGAGRAPSHDRARHARALPGCRARRRWRRLLRHVRRACTGE